MWNHYHYDNIKLGVSIDLSDFPQYKEAYNLLYIY